MKRFLLPLCIVMLASACGSENGTDASEADLVRPEAEVSQMRMVAGRWQSRTGVLPGQDRRHLVVDFANDGSVSMTLRERGPKMDIIIAESTGTMVLGEDSISGTLDEPGRDLRGFRSFSAAMPREGVLSLKGSGIGVDMTYSGQ